MTDFTTIETQNHVLDALRDGILNVVFTKIDGTQRNLICTLNEDRIPADKKPKGTKSAKNDAALPVFDMENNSWRSFRWDSVQKIDILA